MGLLHPPVYSLYLDPRWQPPRDHDHLDWPDFGVPTDISQVTASLRSLLKPTGEGQLVEMGCIGWHGRTGSALACLAILTDHPQEQAVAWVRANYCVHAVETVEQADFVHAFHG